MLHATIHCVLVADNPVFHKTDHFNRTVDAGFHPEKENSQIFSASLEVISLFIGAAFAIFGT